MLASTDWGGLGEFGGFLLCIGSALLVARRWINHNVIRTLRIVTGEPETDDDPGKPSLYALTKKAASSAEEAKATGEEALRIAKATAADLAEVKRQIQPSNGKTTATIIEETAASVGELKRSGS